MEKVNPCKNWGALGGGSYPNICYKIDNRWVVAVGPKILDYEYKDNGELLTVDYRGFSKRIRVFLRLKDEYPVSKDEPRYTSLECHAGDIKAHSFNKYSYEKSKNDKNYKSKTVSKADVKPAVKNGIIQTGIRYPKAKKGIPVATDNWHNRRVLWA